MRAPTPLTLIPALALVLAACGGGHRRAHRHVRSDRNARGHG